MAAKESCGRRESFGTHLFALSLTLQDVRNYEVYSAIVDQITTWAAFLGYPDHGFGVRNASYHCYFFFISLRWYLYHCTNLPMSFLSTRTSPLQTATLEQEILKDGANVNSQTFIRACFMVVLSVTASTTSLLLQFFMSRKPGWDARSWIGHLITLSNLLSRIFNAENKLISIMYGKNASSCLLSTGSVSLYCDVQWSIIYSIWLHHIF